MAPKNLVKIGSMSLIEEFVSQKTLALVGASRDTKKFGSYALRELRARGYRVLAVHPTAPTLEGEPCYPGLSQLPEIVGGVVVIVPPAQAVEVVRMAAAAGITRIWLQQGAGSEETVRVCKESNLPCVQGRCILMFAEPVRSFHRFHRGCLWLFGRLPR